MRRRRDGSFGALCLAAGLALALGGAAAARADSCSAVCPDASEEPACNEGRAVWGFREPGGVCRGGSFGYLESRETAEAERLRLARSQKRRCDESGDCERFEALDAAVLVCLACVDGGSASAGPQPSEPVGGKAPPCDEDEWLRAASGPEPARCFVEFAALPPRIALQGRCVEGDCRSGNGTLEWPSGESYSGAFRAGKRNGQGSFRWPDGRAYVGEWRDGQPTGLGTRIYASGRYKAGYFDRGRYLGADLEHQARTGGPRPRATSTPPATSTRSCEEACTEDAELQLSRINDEYECCFARHAFCRQKGEVALESCAQPGCAAAARQQQEACDIRYACDAVQTQKVTRYRRERAACVEGCSSQELDEHGLRISERGTLLDDD